MRILPAPSSKEFQMYQPRQPRNLRLRSAISPEDVSEAWRYLYNLPQPNFLNPDPELPPPPKNLQHLSDADWFLLDQMLAREMRESAMHSQQ
jgi:hypothetical protein